MAPGASLAHPCSNLRSFGSKCTEVKKVLVILLGLFAAQRSHSTPSAVIRRPHSDSATGELRPRYAPAINWVRGRALNHRLFKTLCEDLGSKNLVLLYHTSPPALTWESLTPLLRTARTNQSLS